MAKIEVYSGGYCPFCTRAKALLNKRKLAFSEYDVVKHPEKREEMQQRAPGARTIPQIFINERHVGGCDELYTLDRKGELETWLNG